MHKMLARAAAWAFLLISLAQASGTFRQNAAHISRGADTNTQEDFHHVPTGEPKQGKLRVFILPHSHDDPGWVRTADQYYDFLVGPMYNTVISALSEDSSRRFQAVEMIYFKQWYENATTHQRAQAHQLVEGGQLTFSVGGWVMPDEATTDYPDLIETMAVGHRWIYDTFGQARVRHGFQVDPFGASSSFAAISRKLGLETHLVARLNYYDKGWMQDNKQLEFVWRPSPSLWRSEGLQIFTHIMDQYQYSAPGIPVKQQLEHLCAAPHNQTDCPGGGFYWDGDDSHPASYWTEQLAKQGFMVYPGVNASNVQFYSDFLVNNSRARAEWFATPNLLWPFGTDFQYSNATAMFSSMDKIVAHVNQRNGPGGRYEGVSLQYSSLQEYFAAVRRAKPSGWAVRGGGDFLPYSTLNCGGASPEPLPGQCSGNAGPQFNVSWPQVWSGFFTSHAELKIQTRASARELRAVDQLVALDGEAGANQEQLKLRSAVGLLPHHDALSGTMGPGCGNDPSKGQDPHKCAFLPMGTPGNVGEVAQDYSGRLAAGVAQATMLRQQSARRILGAGSDQSSLGAFELLQRGAAASVAVQNPLGWQVTTWVHLPVPSGVQRVRVLDSAHQPVPAELVPGGALDCAPGHQELCAQARPGPEEPHNRLFFRAAVPPLGLAGYSIEPLAAGSELPGAASLVPAAQPTGPLTVSNHFFALQFSEGSLTELTELSRPEHRMRVSQRLQEYESFSETVNQTNSAGQWSLAYTGARSGSYLLHSSTGSPGPVSGAYSTPRVQLVRGRHVVEVRQQFSPRHTQVWRLYQGRDPMAGGFVELEYGLGPLEGNREVVSSFQSEIQTQGSTAGSVFFTDDNGFQMQRREYTGLRKFPDGSSQNVSPGPSYTTALSFYPIVRTAYIQDHQHQLLLLAQQTGAVTSRGNGELEVMMHRRSLQDDSKGACQCFNDTSGEYAEIPLDTSAGTGCAGYKVAGTCRADACPVYAVPMNISTRVHPVHWLLAGSNSAVGSRWRQLSQQLNNRPSVVELGRGSIGAGPFAPLGKHPGLPREVHLLSLQVARKDGRAVRLVRLQNIYEMDAARGPTVVHWGSSGLCQMLGHVPVHEVLLNGLPMDRHSNHSDSGFGADEGLTRLDALGNRAGAAAESAEGAEVLPEGPNHSTDACLFSSLLWPQDVKTFIVG